MAADQWAERYIRDAQKKVNLMIFRDAANPLCLTTTAYCARITRGIPFTKAMQAVSSWSSNSVEGAVELCRSKVRDPPVTIRDISELSRLAVLELKTASGRNEY